MSTIGDLPRETLLHIALSIGDYSAYKAFRQTSRYIHDTLKESEHYDKQLKAHIKHIRALEIFNHYNNDLGQIPENLRSLEVCRLAVAQDGLALAYVPEEHKTVEMCRVAVAQHGEALYYVSIELRTVEMCRVAVAQDGEALGYVPIELKTVEMCRVAVAQDREALRYVPRSLRNML